MSTSSSSPAEYVRRGLLKINDATVLAAVDTLNLRGSGKISAVVGMPLRSLQQRRDVASFAVSAPLAAVKALLELLAMSPLEQVIQELGDHADSPTYEQLAGAVDQLLAKGSSNDDIVALLTFAIGEEFPASPHCRRLLEERPDLELPQLPEIEFPSSLLTPKEVDPDIRDQRRARREAERESKKSKNGTAPTRPPRPSKVKGHEAKVAATPSTVAPKEELVTAIGRRQVILTPAELDEFSTDHPLVGAVVIAEVPFDSVDPVIPEQRAKGRPALVVAASEDGILVRGIYSNPAVTRVLFSPWRRLGLDHVSYLDVERVVVTNGALGESLRLGRLTDAEWNGLS